MPSEVVDGVQEDVAAQDLLSFSQPCGYEKDHRDLRQLV